MNKLRLSFFGGIGLLAMGLLLGVGPFLDYWRSRNVHQTATTPFSVVASATTAVPSEEAIISGQPTRLRIPHMNIDLNVVDGQYNPNTKAWTLTKDKVHFALVTPQPNNKSGNTFMYAHNRPGVFKDLSKLAVGDKVIITTDNNHTFTYAFRIAYETDPSDTTVFDYEGAPILTLQTCSGVWYQNRQLFTFDLVEAE